MAQKPSAFISYSTKDKSVARRLAHDLESLGIGVWFDEEEISAGDSARDNSGTS